MFNTMILRFKSNPLWLAFILISALGVFQARLVAGEFLFNVDQVAVTQKLVAADLYRGIECGTVRTADSTRSLLSMAIALNPDDARATYRIGTLAWLEGNCESALAYWQASANENTSISARASVALARGLLRLRMREPAIEIARQAKLESYFYQLGYSREIAGDAPAAIDLYSFALEVRPTYETANRLARVYEGQKNTQAERGLWLKMIAESPSGSMLHSIATAEIAAQDREWDTLFDASTRAAQATQNIHIQFDLYLRLGRAMEEGKQSERAILAYEKAIEIAPGDSSEPYTSLARIFLANKDYAKANDWADRVVALFPRDPWAYIRAAEVAEGLNNQNQARQRFDVALQIAPQHLGTLWSTAMFENRQGNRTIALTLLERASTLTPSCESWRLIAEGYTRLGESQRATPFQQLFSSNCSR
ncbi:MAG: hypothetical protein HY868_12255 [Chloroflexi bacterium]|nr:hypothetical protein [Chloroflexota bacterium]